MEHIWDGPCHRSLFTRDGKLIDNSATGDLKKQAEPRTPVRFDLFYGGS